MYIIFVIKIKFAKIFDTKAILPLHYHAKSLFNHNPQNVKPLQHNEKLF